MFIIYIFIVIVRFHSPQTTIKQIHDQIGNWLVQSKLRKTREDKYVYYIFYDKQ